MGEVPIITLTCSVLLCCEVKDEETPAVKFTLASANDPAKLVGFSTTCDPAKVLLTMRTRYILKPRSF